VLDVLLARLRQAPLHTAFVLERRESHRWREQLPAFLRREGMSDEELRGASLVGDPPGGDSPGGVPRGDLPRGDAGGAPSGVGVAAREGGGARGDPSSDPTARRLPRSWCPPTTLCHHPRYGERGPPRRDGYALEAIDDLHAGLVRPSGGKHISLASRSGLGRLLVASTRALSALNALSLIDNVGDFQLAHRALWRRAPFAEELSGRQFADTALMAAWLNCNATVYVPSKVHVFHLSHVHPHPTRTPALWARLHINKMPHFVVKRQAHGRGPLKIVDTRGVLTAVPAQCRD